MLVTLGKLWNRLYLYSSPFLAILHLLQAPLSIGGKVKIPQDFNKSFNNVGLSLVLEFQLSTTAWTKHEPRSAVELGAFPHPKPHRGHPPPPQCVAEMQ